MDVNTPVLSTCLASVREVTSCIGAGFGQTVNVAMTSLNRLLQGCARKFRGCLTQYAVKALPSIVGGCGKAQFFH